MSSLEGVKMPWTSAHLDWLTNTGTSITTIDGKDAEI
jgi:hypothetical protein